MNKSELKEQILKASDLTIREGIFIRKENDKFVKLLQDVEKFLKRLMGEMNYEFSYRVYFSIPYSFSLSNAPGQTFTLPIGDEPNPPNLRSAADPKGSESNADTHLKKVVPLWTGRISSDWFDSKFSQLDVKLESIWSELDKYHQNDNFETAPQEFKKMDKFKAAFPEDIEMEKGCEETDVEEIFKEDLLSVLKKYFSVLEFKKKTRKIKFNLSGTVFSAKPDIEFLDSEDYVFFFIELKRNGLSNYVDGDVIKDGEEMNSIMKQVLKYMIASTTDCCIISDVEVSILVQLDFEGAEKILCDKFITNVPFKYHIFRPDDTIHTFQAIICSVAYDQKLRMEDPIQRKNVQRLKELIVLESFRIGKPDNESTGSTQSDSYSSYSYNEGLSMIRTFQLPIIEEQDPNPEDISDDSKPNNQNNSWSQYMEKEFYIYEGEFEVLQPGVSYLNTVLKLNRKAIDRNFSYLNIHPSVSYVIIKVYDLFNVELYIENYDLPTSYSELKRSMGSKFNAEFECYKRMNAYNESRGTGEYLRVPKLYGCGGCYVKKDEETFTNGYYFILEYIEKDQDQRFNLEDASYQLKLLRSLGIQHNDIHQRNIVVRKGKFNLIDFSEAKLDNIDPHKDLESLNKVYKENSVQKEQVLFRDLEAQAKEKFKQVQGTRAEDWEKGNKPI